MAIAKKNPTHSMHFFKKSSVDADHKFPAFQKKFWNDCREGML